MIIFKINSDPGEVISVLSLSGRCHKCPSFAALTRDIYDIVPLAIKLILHRPSYDNLYIYMLVKFILNIMI